MPDEKAVHGEGEDGQPRTQFDFLLNAADFAGHSTVSSKVGYREKRLALFAYVRELERVARSQPIRDLPELGELAESAWGIIANAGGSDWTRESEEWREAAARWRDRYHAWLGTLTPTPAPRATQEGSC